MFDLNKDIYFNHTSTSVQPMNMKASQRGEKENNYKVDAYFDTNSNNFFICCPLMPTHLFVGYNIFSKCQWFLLYNLL